MAWHPGKTESKATTRVAFCRIIMSSSDETVNPTPIYAYTANRFQIVTIRSNILKTLSNSDNKNDQFTSTITGKADRPLWTVNRPALLRPMSKLNCLRLGGGKDSVNSGGCFCQPDSLPIGNRTGSIREQR
jgi:hypothetical protein